jgi:hypothetical protein
MKILLAFVLLTSTAYAGDPNKDLYGSIESYKNSTTIKVTYVKDPLESKLVCGRLGFKVKEEKGTILYCEFSQNTQLRKLIELVSQPEIKSVAPNPKVAEPNNE